MLYHIPGSNNSEVQKLRRDYERQVEDGTISPNMWDDLSPNNTGDIRKNRGYITKRTKDRIDGFLLYTRLAHQSLEKLALEMQYYEGKLFDESAKRLEGVDLGKVKGFCDYESGDIIHIDYMESFEKGTGRALVCGLQQIKSPGLIFLGSLTDDSTNFYEAVGLTNTKIYTSVVKQPGKPLFTWTPNSQKH